jgi:hypothetical protein
LTNSEALDVVVRSIPLLDATHLTGNSGVSRIEKLGHLCQEDESLRAKVGNFNAKINSNSAETTMDIGSEKHEAQPSKPANEQSDTRSTALSSQICEIFESVNVSEEERPDLETRITALVESGRVYEEHLEDMRLIASSEIRDAEPVPMSSVVALLEEGVTLGAISIATQLRSKLAADGDVNMAELLSDAEMANMTERSFERTIFSPRNLPVELLQDFCDEFKFDVDLAAGTGSLGDDYDHVSQAADEIAEALIRAINAGEGETIEAKVRSILTLSRERKELGGNFDMLMRFVGE